VSYDVSLDLTDPDGRTFGSRTVVRFRSAGESTFLELASAGDLTVRVDGTLVEPAYDGHRIHLRLDPSRGRHEVVVDARLPYTTDGEGLHRAVDPADGQAYLGAYLGLDLAQRVYACFDQNDLKAPITTTVLADPSWTVLANGRAVTDGPTAGDGRWTFATTPPIPPALFTVAAGPWRSVRWEHAGLPFGWHARASLAAELDRDAAELRSVTERCFDHYAGLFDEPYPFDSYDQVLVPGLNWGAQEMPGCVLFRDELLPRGRVPAETRVLRASIVAHEMAHMWFGDSMTMTWWEDTWLQESFADYMGYRVAADAAGFPGAQVTHEIMQKPTAYVADERRSTHPVAPAAEDVPDVDSAATIFDAISYAKGNSVLRQLATWLGDEAFLRGVNAHLNRHRFGNATLADLVDSLAGVTDRDVRGWVDLWLRRSGFDTLRVERAGDVPVLHRDGSRPHRITVAAYDGDLTETDRLLVDVADDPVALPQLAGRIVVPNVAGETFARIVLDERSRAAVAEGLAGVGDDVARAVLWAMALDEVHTRSLPVDGLVGMVERHLPAEGDPTVVTALLEHVLGRLVPLRAAPDEAAPLIERVAAACSAGLAGAPSADLAAALARGVAVGSPDAGMLLGWLDTDTVAGQPLAPALRWRVLQRLAELGAVDADRIEAERRRAPGLDADLGAAAALAARPTPEATEAAWRVAEAGDVDNRTFAATLRGLWAAGPGDLLAPYVERYLREAPRWAARGQGFAQVVGRSRPPFALTAAQVALLDEACAGDLPTVLRRQWEDWRDDLR